MPAMQSAEVGDAMTYDFPIVTVPGDLFAVLKKVREESHEVRRAILYDESPARICEEIADLRQVVETLQRRATQLYGPLMMAQAEEFVIEKNKKRGYYDEICLLTDSPTITHITDPAEREKFFNDIYRGPAT